MVDTVDSIGKGKAGDLLLSPSRRSLQSSFVGVSKNRKSNRKERAAKIFEQKHEDTENFFVADHWTRIMLQDYHDTKLSDESLLNFKKYRKPPPRKSTGFAKAKKPLEEPLDPKYYPVISHIVEESPYLTEKDHYNLAMIKAACTTSDDIFNSTYKHLLSFQADYKSKPGQYKVDPIDVELSRNIPKETLLQRSKNPYFESIDSPILKKNKYHIGTEKFIFSDNFKVKVVPHCVTLEQPPSYPPKSSSSGGKVKSLKAAVSSSRRETEAGGAEEKESKAVIADVTAIEKKLADDTTPAVDTFPYDAFADDELLELLVSDNNKHNSNAAKESTTEAAAETQMSDAFLSSQAAASGEVLWDGATETNHTSNNNNKRSDVEVTSGDIVSCLVGMMSADLVEKQKSRRSHLAAFQETLRDNQLAAEEQFRTSHRPLMKSQTVSGTLNNCNGAGRPLSASATLRSSHPTISSGMSNRPQSAGRFGGISRASPYSEPVLLASVRPHSAHEISRRLNQQAQAKNTSQGGEYLISSRRTSSRPVLNRSLPASKWKDVLSHF